MPDEPQNQPAETEKGFGTGLRAQLERRRSEDGRVPEQQASTNVELRLELRATPAETEPAAADEEVGALKAELESAQRREAALRSRLDQHSAAFGDGMSSEMELEARAATLDAREAKLAEFEGELEERERKVRDQREVIEAEHARVAELQAELAADQQLAAEQLQKAEARMRQLQGADREREKAAGDLNKQLSALAQREKKQERKESELATREQAADVRLQGRERSLDQSESANSPRARPT